MSLFHPFHRAKIKQQLFTTFLFAIALPILAIGFFLIHTAQKNLKSHYLDQTNAENLRVKSVLFDVTTNMFNLSEGLANDAALQTLLTTTYQDAKNQIYAFDRYKGITNKLMTETAIATITIFYHDDAIPPYANYHLITDKVRQEEWYQKAASRAGIFWVTKETTDKWDNHYYQLTLYRKIPLIETGDFFIVEITVSDNYLKSRIDNNVLSSIASVNQDLVFYTTDRLLKGKPLPLLIDYAQPYYAKSGILTIDGEEYIGAVTTLQPFGADDNLYITSFSKSALPYIRQTMLLYTAIVLLALLLPCLLLYLFSRYFSTRVNTLRSAMHQASNGDYNIITSFQGNDELSEAFLDLQLMIQEIKEKDALMYEAALREQQIENRQQQMEFKMLASQINPHFLYNTLETIRMKAFTAGNQEVATAIKLLGKSLRYVLENTGTASTTLQKELEYIETYLTIQRLRFGDKVNYTLLVEPDLNLSDIHILPLLLQPVVENAILHGLEGVEESGRITIHIYTETVNSSSMLYIAISDNGAGMEEDDLNELKKKISLTDTTRTQSIGLYNIQQRISLCYGPKYGLELKSTKGNGTCVQLCLPYENCLEEL